MMVRPAFGIPGMMMSLPAIDPAPLSIDTDGAVRVGGTRVTLDTVIHAFRDGATPEEIVEQYPSIGLDIAYHVIGYYLKNRATVDAYLAEREQKHTRVKIENETRWKPAGTRERLMARRQAAG